jgi:hypothetical protein
MNRFIRLVIAIAAMVAYLSALRYVAPSEQPYFIMGIGIVGTVAWLLGMVPAMLAALLLIPLTDLIYKQFLVSVDYIGFSSSPAYLGIQIMAAVAIGFLRREYITLSRKKVQLVETNVQLQKVLSHVQELGGIHNLCSECKAIQNDNGEWQSVDIYLKAQTKMEFSHCICPDCAEHFHEPSPPDSSV